MNGFGEIYQELVIMSLRRILARRSEVWREPAELGRDEEYLLDFGKG